MNLIKSQPHNDLNPQREKLVKTQKLKKYYKRNKWPQTKNQYYTTLRCYLKNPSHCIKKLPNPIPKIYTSPDRKCQVMKISKNLQVLLLKKIPKQKK